MAVPLKLNSGEIQQLQAGDLPDPQFRAVQNTVASSFSIPAASGMAIVGYLTLQSNAYVTIPGGSLLFLMN